MPYAAFHELCPEVAQRETRVLTVLPGATLGVPPGEYQFVEMFCNEPDCDCRRAFFTVLSLPKEDFEAVIAWGWEDAAFYARWFGMNDPSIVQEMQGPILNLASPQGKNSKALLEIFRKVLLADAAYVERIKRHYELFRTKIDGSKKSNRPHGKVIRTKRTRK